MHLGEKLRWEGLVIQTPVPWLISKTRGPGQKMFGACEDHAVGRDVGFPGDSCGSHGGYGLPSCDFMSGQHHNEGWNSWLQERKHLGLSKKNCELGNGLRPFTKRWAKSQWNWSCKCCWGKNASVLPCLLLWCCCQRAETSHQKHINSGLYWYLSSDIQKEMQFTVSSLIKSPFPFFPGSHSLTQASCSPLPFLSLFWDKPSLSVVLLTRINLIWKMGVNFYQDRDDVVEC